MSSSKCYSFVIGRRNGVEICMERQRSLHLFKATILYFLSEVPHPSVEEEQAKYAQQDDSMSVFNSLLSWFRETVPLQTAAVTHSLPSYPIPKDWSTFQTLSVHPQLPASPPLSPPILQGLLPFPKPDSTKVIRKLIIKAIRKVSLLANRLPFRSPSAPNPVLGGSPPACKPAPLSYILCPSSPTDLYMKLRPLTNPSRRMKMVVFLEDVSLLFRPSSAEHLLSPCFLDFI